MNDALFTKFIAILGLGILLGFVFSEYLKKYWPWLVAVSPVP